MAGALNIARMRLTMDASGNSSSCLAAQACLPLGGHSVAAALPALRNGTGSQVWWVGCALWGINGWG